MNEAVTNGSNALVLGAEVEASGRQVTVEAQLSQQTSLIEQKALGLVIKTDQDCVEAGEITKLIKRQQKQVRDFFEPLRIATKDAYDKVLARKKEMLAPLESAEKILKASMSRYVDEKERQRREQENAMRLLAEQEVTRKLEEAAVCEANGDELGAECAMTEAEVMDCVAVGGGIHTQVPKTKGVSVSRDWKIVSIDDEKVPVSINGAVIRPVDEKAILRLIKATKGKIQIPGVKYKETSKISVRG